MIARELMLLLFERFCWFDSALQAQMRGHGSPEISRPQSMVMLCIASGTTRPADVARRVGVSRQAIYATINQLVDKELIYLTDDPDDRRQKQLAMTDYGQRAREDAQKSLAELGDILVERIGMDQLEAMLAALRADWGSTNINLIDN